MTVSKQETMKPTTKQKIMSGALAGVLMTSLGVAAPMVAMTQTANAAPADSLQAAKRLNRLLTNTKSMSADFSQTTKALIVVLLKGQ